MHITVGFLDHGSGTVVQLSTNIWQVIRNEINSDENYASTGAKSASGPEEQVLG